LAKLEQPPAQTASAKTWQIKLRELIRSCSPEAKVGFIGVGHPLRGDDYVGSYVAKSIRHVTGGVLPDGAYLFDVEDNVESIISKIASLDLRHIIFIDSCEMGLRPGAPDLRPIEETSYPFFTTHGIPLKVLAEQLLSKSEVWVLAIQPKQADFGENLSTEVLETAIAVSDLIASNLISGGQAIAR
jgi:hydrogenase 3 maturation protease